jgi:hypothetical protein
MFLGSFEWDFDAFCWHALFFFLLFPNISAFASEE